MKGDESQLLDWDELWGEDWARGAFADYLVGPTDEPPEDYQYGQTTTDAHIAVLLAEDLDGHFVELMEGYQPLLWRRALHMVRNIGRARDMVQRTWVIAYRTLKRYREEYGVQRIRGLCYSSWLERILEREVYQDSRREKKYVPFAALEEETLAVWEAPEGEQPEVIVLREERRRELVELVMQLPPLLREVILLRYFSASREWDAETFGWIGRKLGRAEGTVRVDHHRALARLRRQLQQQAGQSA